MPREFVQNEEVKKNVDIPVAPAPDNDREGDVGGLTIEEIRDPNRISVTISDPNCPVVIFFGARTSGKTMTLVRITRYLRAKGYRVNPDQIFRSGDSYKKMCKDFDKVVLSDNAADGTNLIAFMLVTVRDGNGRAICQFLEAPGEHYFDPDNIRKPFPPYIFNVMNMCRRITWCFIMERNWLDAQTRNNYAQKMIDMLNQIPTSNKIIFMCHKVDLSPELYKNGHPIASQFRKEINLQYPGVFDRFKNPFPISLIEPYRFKFVTFSAGAFWNTASGVVSYQPSADFYPKELWKTINSCL